MLRDPSYVKSAKKLITPTMTTNFVAADSRGERRSLSGMQNLLTQSGQESSAAGPQFLSGELHHLLPMHYRTPTPVTAHPSTAAIFELS